MKYQNCIDEVLKMFFSRTTGPFSIKPGITHAWVNIKPNYPNKGTRPFPKEDDNKKRKCNDEIKQSSLGPLCQFQPI